MCAAAGAMDLRVPLACVLSSPLGHRHAIPHRTLRLGAAHPFVEYLDSDDTRLPQHPTLAVVAQSADAYETYVGEDVWHQQEPNNSSDNKNGEGNGDTDAVPRFDDVVQWVIEALSAVGGDGAGVVLCGRCVVADDCGWAVLSRTPALHSPRDVFVTMRNSSKFLRDVHHQLRGEKSGEEAEEAASAPVQVELTLAKSMGGDPVKEFRVFLPYRLYTTDGEVQVELWDDHVYAGISQRATDVCFPALMAWDVERHDESYAVVMRHVTNAMVLEKALAKDIQLRAALLRQAAAVAGCGGDDGKRREVPCVLLLSVDVLFESLSLPVHLLSAKVRCFRHDDERDPACTFPFIQEDNTATSHNSRNHKGDDEDDGSEESGEEDMLYDSVSFFRLFRDAANWNRHVELWRQRHSRGEASDVCASQQERRYFVIASERSDLAPTKETMAKKGLPLEFIRPELMQGDEEFQREWREKLMQCMSAVGHPQGSK
ncbi:hypothetical protein DQ04_03631020 [Trypanosoma grayi]|uniref:hypothetical protein n=1 Tax=Trypanosoma grayi TaxID=71804 RepID=UPI0004F4441D|nr:hypothetical protein DQ04_03631020 [Trypanosoma grayi]KEG10505.1 hypothetical protein DQ04_03631020 [Trypanosoma grayi]